MLIATVSMLITSQLFTPSRRPVLGSVANAAPKPPPLRLAMVLAPSTWPPPPLWPPLPPLLPPPPPPPWPLLQALLLGTLPEPPLVIWMDVQVELEALASPLVALPPEVL